MQHPELATFMAQLASVEQDEIASLIKTVPTWRWPRSDLHSWTKALNRLDSVLADIIRDYAVNALQLNVFTPHTKTTLLEILRFLTMLLENSTNRKLFASYDVCAFGDLIGFIPLTFMLSLLSVFAI